MWPAIAILCGTGVAFVIPILACVSRLVSERHERTTFFAVAVTCVGVPGYCGAVAGGPGWTIAASSHLAGSVGYAVLSLLPWWNHIERYVIVLVCVASCLLFTHAR